MGKGCCFTRSRHGGACRVDEKSFDISGRVTLVEVVIGLGTSVAQWIGRRKHLHAKHHYRARHFSGSRQCSSRSAALVIAAAAAVVSAAFVHTVGAAAGDTAAVSAFDRGGAAGSHGATGSRRHEGQDVHDPAGECVEFVAVFAGRPEPSVESAVGDSAIGWSVIAVGHADRVHLQRHDQGDRIREDR